MPINQHFLHIKIFRRKSNCNMVLEIFCNLFDWILWIHKVHHVCACVGCDGVVKKWVELVYGGRVKMTFKVCGRKTIHPLHQIRTFLQIEPIPPNKSILGKPQKIFYYTHT